MSKRESIQTTIPEIVAYWSRRVDESGLSVDWSEAKTHCWRCGCERNVQRCHIVPDSLGGKDEPSNIVLLCSRCHADGPNVADPDVMWDWIRAYGVAFYGTFWSCMGMKEYKFIYHKSLNEELRDILEAAGLEPNGEEVQELVDRHLRETAEQASIHFGQPY